MKLKLEKNIRLVQNYKQYKKKYLKVFNCQRINKLNLFSCRIHENN